MFRNRGEIEGEGRRERKKREKTMKKMKGGRQAPSGVDSWPSC